MRLFGHSQALFSPKELACLWKQFVRNISDRRKGVSLMKGPVGRGSLSVAWWNTSISPYGNGASKSNKNNVLTTILDLATENDLVGLGEFADDTMMHEIEMKLPLYKKLQSLYYKSGRIEFKSAIIYDSAVLKMVEIDEDNANLVKADSAAIYGQYRVGQKVRMELQALQAIVDVYLVHWSQKDEPYGDARKQAAATRLNRDIFGEEKCRLKDAAAILMGNFNSEPCSCAFAPLNVSRSSQYVRQRGGLYNPFWRKLHDENGTLKELNANDVRCDVPLFDSIMVTSTFLNLPGCKVYERIYGCKYYNPQHAEHSPVGLKIVWRKD